MLPTFEVIGDSVIISRYYRRGRGVKVGDIVSFDSVVEPGESVIKRVLGMPGDYVLRDTPGTTDTMIQVSQRPFGKLQNCADECLGTRRPLLGHRGQSRVVERLEAFWANANGVNQRQGYCESVALE
jgi:Signal peptidase, peptidase S26